MNKWAVASEQWPAVRDRRAAIVLRNRELMTVTSYRELIAWQKAVDFVVAVYRATERFPAHETYGLRVQVRKSAVSVPSNIAEGQCRRTTKEFLNFLSISRGSLGEAETQVIIADRLGYFEPAVCTSLLESAAEVGRLVNGLMNSLMEKLAAAD